MRKNARHSAQSANRPTDACELEPRCSSRPWPAGRRRKTIATRLLLSLLAAALIAGTGCHDDEVIIVSERGVVVTDFGSIAEYLDDPTVRLILTRVPRHRGDGPPNASGEYSASGVVTASSFPDIPVGSDSDDFFFCLGSPSGGSLNAEVLDVSVDNNGVSSFIEGSGDNFTVYTAFRSVSQDGAGRSCEIHEVVVISGTREADGSLSNLFIGQGVTGLVGECPDVFIDDMLVFETVGTRIGQACDLPTGGSESLVELTVENSLLNDALVFIEYEEPPLSGDFVLGRQPFIVLPLEPSETFFVPPGFFLSFDSLQPSTLDELGSENLLGEVVTGFFDQDVTSPGGFVDYLIENQVGDDVFFAPQPVNRTPEAIFTIVNSGFDFGAAPEPLGSGLGCRCPIEPGPNPQPQNIGYYSYSIPSTAFTENDANVRFFSIADDFEFPGFNGPFTLEAGTGAVVLDVIEPPAPMPGVN